MAMVSYVLMTELVERICASWNEGFISLEPWWSLVHCIAMVPLAYLQCRSSSHPLRHWCRLLLVVMFISQETWSFMHQGGHITLPYLIMTPFLSLMFDCESTSRLLLGYAAVNALNLFALPWCGDILSRSHYAHERQDQNPLLLDPIRMPVHGRSGQMLRSLRVILPVHALFLILSVIFQHVQKNVRLRESILRDHFVTYESLLASFPCIIWSVDKDLRLRIHRDGIFDRPTELVNNVQLQDLSNFGPPFTREVVDDIVSRHRRVIEDGLEDRYTLESIGTGRADESCSLLVRLRPLLDRDTRCIKGAVGLGVQVTELIRVKTELQRSKEKYFRLLQCISDTIICVDRNLIVRFINAGSNNNNNKPSLIELTPGKSLLEGFKNIAPVVERVLRGVVERREPATFEWMVNAETGDCFQEADMNDDELSSNLLSGRVHCYMAHINSLSDENVIDDKTDTYDQILLNIRDMTMIKSSIEQRRMVEKMEIESQSKSEFINQLSHEIRNPLTIIIGSLNLLDSDEAMNAVPDICRQHVKDCMESAQLLVSIFDEVLDFKRLEHGGTILSETPSSVLETVELVVTTHRSLASRKHLELMSLVDTQIPNVLLFDRLRLTQIISNLVSNAIKFTNTGFVRLSAHIVDETDEMVKICFSCVDSGIGIREEHISNIFKPFFQIHEDYNPQEYRGFGVGLGIVKHLVDSMKGQIEIASKPGEGTTCSVTLPMHRVSESEAPPSAIVDQLHKSIFHTAIVINSREEYRDIMQHYLAALGVRHIQLLTYSQLLDTQRPDSLFLRIERMLVEEPQAKIAIIFEYTDNEVMLKLIQRTKELGLRCIILAEQEPRFSGCHVVQKPICLNALMQALCNGETQRESSRTESPELQERAEPATNFPVLVVEDNPIVQRVLVKLLRKIGFNRLFTANNGKEAVDFITHAQIQDIGIVLMDLQMPVMSGLEATELVRKMEDQRKRNLPIIAVTANCDKDTRSKCESYGFDDLVQKPLSADFLGAVMKRAILRRASIS